MLPALIDPHVHFRTPGHEYKENWETAAKASIAGGVTTVLDMPNTNPATTTKTLIAEKKLIIDEQLKNVDIPLRYELYLGASQDTLGEIANAKGDYVAIKVYMGQSTGDLLMDNDEAFREVCRLAAEQDVLVCVHAEDQCCMDTAQNNLNDAEATDVKSHSKVRGPDAARTAAKRAIATAKEFGTRLMILHASSKDEVALVREAKAAGQNVYLETTPHHLFLNESDYERWGTKIQMNPPVRTTEDQDALWEGIRDGTIDTIGTDHAPHTLEEKMKPFGEAPSGVPGVETVLPLLLTAVRDGKLSLHDVIRVTHIGPQDVYRLPPNNDLVLVDMDTIRTVRDEELHTKCAWSPFAGRNLIGWPTHTIIGGRVFDAKAATEILK